MSIFNFFRDKKYSTLYRTHFDIEAKDLTEAKKLAIKQSKEDIFSDKYSTEEVEMCLEDISIEDNSGQYTEQLFFENEVGAVEVWNNVENNISAVNDNTTSTD